MVTDYNPDGTVLDQKDGKGNAIQSYTYDSLARVATVTDALGNVTTYTYDGNGNQLTKQQPGGNCSAQPATGCTSYSYDSANQLLGITPNVTNITYDADGQRTGMTDGSGSSSWGWDSLHRMVSYQNGNGASVAWIYNLRSLPTTITYPGTLNVIEGYDSAGRWSSVKDWNNNSTSFGYDANSNLTTETLPSVTGVVDTFGFDDADNLTSISDAKGSTNLFSATYTRDSANQLLSDTSATTNQTNFKYTALNQLCYAGSGTSGACSSPPSGSLPYAYDQADNLIQTGSSQQVFNSADELCWTASRTGSCASPPSGATTYSYDTRGNRTSVTPSPGQAQTLTYDQANRLTSYAAASTTTYAYNGDGLRMSKTQSGTTTQYLWNVAGGLPLLLKDGSTSYIYGPGGLPLEQIAGSTTSYLHHDQIGSTRLITSSTGSSVATYRYDSYGNLIASSGTITNPLRFTGQYQDAESGLYYLRARYYDPTTGQFSRLDPKVGSTRQPYAYALGNPLNSTDPSGLYTFGPCVGISVQVGFAWHYQVCLVVAIDQHTGHTQIGLTGTSPLNNKKNGLPNEVGTPSPLSLSVVWQSSTANRVRELQGPFLGAGGTVGDVTGGALSSQTPPSDDPCAPPILVTELGPSFGIPWVEAHAGWTVTGTKTYWDSPW